MLRNTCTVYEYYDVVSGHARDVERYTVSIQREYLISITSIHIGINTGVDDLMWNGVYYCIHLVS